MTLFRITKFALDLAGSSLVLVLSTLISLTIGSLFQPAWAGATSIVLELSIPPQAQYSDLVMQAKLLANESIARYFNQHSGISTIEVSVLGDRSGDIVPILTMTITRAQWQSQSQTGGDTKYYASHPLLQYRDAWDAGRIATQPRVSNGTAGTSVASAKLPASEIDRAFDEGRLTGEAAQPYLSSLD